MPRHSCAFASSGAFENHLKVVHVVLDVGILFKGTLERIPRRLLLEMITCSHIWWIKGQRQWGIFFGRSIEKVRLAESEY